MPLTPLLLASAVTVGLATAAAGTTGDVAGTTGDADAVATGAADVAATPVSGPPTPVSVSATTVGFGPGRDAAAVLVEATREVDVAEADTAELGDVVTTAGADTVAGADSIASEGTTTSEDTAGTGDAAGTEGAATGGAVADDADPADDDASAVWVAPDGDRIDAERIRAFLADRGAPLATYADELVAAGIRHDVDPRLVVAIAVAESSAGDRKPSGTHNAWGWSGSGPHGLKVWASWPEAIDDFTERLGRLYDTTSVDEDMARTYCPPNWRWWLDTVQWAIGRI